MGNCDFSTSILDPVRDPPVKTPDLRLPNAEAHTPPTIDAEEAVHLLNWFLYSTNGMLYLFDLGRVHAELEAWMRDSQEKSNMRSATFYLVLAIGAQASPNGLDSLAHQYYSYGWHLGTEHAAREPSYASLQYFCLFGAYLMGQSLMNAALIQIGSAVRVAHVLGLHLQTRATAVDAWEAQMRKRLWKTVRLQDHFLSATLGHPIATKHHHDASLVTDCSASAIICDINEAVLEQIYARGSLDDDTVQDIVDRHRVCVGQFDDGLKNDGLGSFEFDEHRRPHIGVCHIKHGTYANIQLLTMPFLIKWVLHRPDITKSSVLNIDQADTLETSLSHESMAFACIDAGISLVGLFHKFLDADQIPRRLPMIVYAMFYAALSLGLAIFGDLDSIFPLQENIRIASQLLFKLGKHDWLAKRYATVITQLQTACKIYVQDRFKNVAGAHRARVQQLFGSLETRTDTDHQEQPCAAPQEVNTLRTSPVVSTITSRPSSTGLDFEEWETYMDALASGSSHSHYVAQIMGLEVDDQPSTCAGEFLQLAEADATSEARLLDGVWFDEGYT
jgi:hypothetical protein